MNLHVSLLKVIILSYDIPVWHMRAHHYSKNWLLGTWFIILMVKFVEYKICDAYARGKETRSSFQQKKHVSTSRPLELLHMNLCRPVKVQSREVKKYILVVVDNFSIFTWTMLLRSKEETYETFITLAKRIQVKYNDNIVGIRPDH